MAQLLVRNLESEVKSRLQRRAAHHGRSMEEEAREILRDAVKEEAGSTAGLGTEIASLFRSIGLNSKEADNLELRGFSFRPVEFEE